jgi:hypothetical protein
MTWGCLHGYPCPCGAPKGPTCALCDRRKGYALGDCADPGGIECLRLLAARQRAELEQARRERDAFAIRCATAESNFADAHAAFECAEQERDAANTERDIFESALNDMTVERDAMRAERDEANTRATLWSLRWGESRRSIEDAEARAEAAEARVLSAECVATIRAALSYGIGRWDDRFYHAALDELDAKYAGKP